MKQSFYTVLLLTAALFTFSCKKTAKTHDLTPSSENEKIEISTEDKKSIDEFSAELETSLNNSETTFFNDRFNISRLGELAIKGLDLTAREKTETTAGLANSLPQAKQQLTQTFSTSQVKYIKFVHETRPALLFRLILEDGSFTYCEFILEKTTTNSKWEIVDLYMYANGKRTSAVMRDSMAQMLPTSGGTDKTMLKAMEQIQEVSRMNSEGKYQNAWVKWKKIDPKTYKNRIILMQGYLAAFHIYYSGSEEIGPLKQIISIMEKEFSSDAGLAILQLSVHEINKDSKKYREAVQKIRDRVGNDPFLDLIESSAYTIDGDYEKLHQAAVKFKELEPNLHMAYPVIWGALLELKDYSRLTKSFDEFIEKFDVEPSAFASDPDFKEFFDTPVGKDWLKNHNL